MDWLQTKYVGLLSTRLERYKQRGNAYNFRCPLCGDSQQDKVKARGYIYDYKGGLKFHCHNCGADMSFDRFLEEIDPGLAAEMSLEKVRERRSGVAKFVDATPKKFDYQKQLDSLVTIAELPDSNPCKQLCVQRLIPTSFHKTLYYAPFFKKFCNSIIPNKFDNVDYDEPRLVIPFIGTNGKMHALQGRSLDPNSKRKYIMIVVDEEVPSLYGFDRVNLSQQTYVVEGPIDSMFLNNCLATGGGDFHTRLTSLYRGRLVLVYDNEPRSRDMIRKMMKAIRAGYTICLWPEKLEEYKDINQMIQAGYSSDYIQYTIDQNLVSGVVSGEVAIKRWSKC